MLTKKLKIETINGDWGLGIGPIGQSPIPNPQSPNYLLTENINSF